MFRQLVDDEWAHKFSFVSRNDAIVADKFAWSNKFGGKLPRYEARAKQTEPLNRTAAGAEAGDGGGGES
ncbi:hypothetical protein RB195_014598 [Necator americanus]|uniref:Uncharacterized protein n=1 Tax=Necator americanus TaxID=51031 RepID=A0ABR1E0U0_NECAM